MYCCKSVCNVSPSVKTGYEALHAEPTLLYFGIRQGPRAATGYSYACVSQALLVCCFLKLREAQLALSIVSKDYRVDQIDETSLKPVSKSIFSFR